MSFLYEYMSDDELRDARENAVYENESLHLDNQMKILCMEHEARISDIDTQVILENYTGDDLTELYKKEMIIFTESVKDWWENFKKWFTGVINALLGKNKHQELPPEEAKKEIELPIDVKKANSIGRRFLDAIKRPFNYKKDDGSINYGKIAGEAVGTTVGLSAIIGTGSFLFKKTKMTKEEASEEVETAVNLAGDIKNEIDNIEPKDGEEGQKECEDRKTIGQAALKLINLVVDKVKPLIHKEGKSESNSEEPKEDENKENSSEDNEPKKEETPNADDTSKKNEEPQKEEPKKDESKKK
jgi:hypothetical protein